jgi:hypothetical protein
MDTLPFSVSEWFSDFHINLCIERIKMMNVQATGTKLPICKKLNYISPGHFASVTEASMRLWEMTNYLMRNHSFKELLKHGHQLRSASFSNGQEPLFYEWVSSWLYKIESKLKKAVNTIQYPLTDYCLNHSPEDITGRNKAVVRKNNLVRYFSVSVLLASVSLLLDSSVLKGDIIVAAGRFLESYQLLAKEGKLDSYSTEKLREAAIVYSLLEKHKHRTHISEDFLMRAKKILSFNTRNELMLWRIEKKLRSSRANTGVPR